MVIAIISIVAAVLLALYVSKSQDYKAQERDNKWLKEQREQAPEPVAVDDVDNHPLDKESAMEAIRYNGFVLKRTTIGSLLWPRVSIMPSTTLASLSKMVAIPSICLRCGFPGDCVPSPRSLESRPILRSRTTCTTMPGSSWPRPM